MAGPIAPLIARMQKALAEGGCHSNAEWQTKFPGVHCWFRPSDGTAASPRNWECCTLCGIVRRADDKNKPCKGQVRIELRDGKDHA